MGWIICMSLRFKDEVKNEIWKFIKNTYLSFFLTCFFSIFVFTVSAFPSFITFSHLLPLQLHPFLFPFRFFTLPFLQFFHLFLIHLCLLIFSCPSFLFPLPASTFFLFTFFSLHRHFFLPSTSSPFVSSLPFSFYFLNFYFLTFNTLIPYIRLLSFVPHSFFLLFLLFFNSPIQRVSVYAPKEF